MTPIPDIILLVIKVLAIVGLGIYTIFAGVLVRQEQLMAHVLEETFEPFIRMLIVGHLVATIVIFFLAFIIL